MRRMLSIFMLVPFLICVACQPASLSTGIQVLPSARTITPYFTVTPAISVGSISTQLPNLQPTATSTPRFYTIQLGDTYSAIALNYGVTVNDLILANPNVNPNALLVGQEVLIPAPSPRSESNASGNPTPTAVPLTYSNPDCYPSLEGGVWCFLLVRNENANPIENMTAVIQVTGIGSGQESSRVAIAPLNIIPAGSVLPLVAYFPAPMPQEFQASAEPQTAFYVPTGDARYLNARLENTVTSIAQDSLSASINGNVVIDGATTANLIWVAATAFDAEDHVVGVRRWESTQALAPGQPLSFSLYVYSSAGAITRVELALEARP